MIRQLLLTLSICFFVQTGIAQPAFFEHYLGSRSDQTAVFFQRTTDGYVIVGSSIDSTYNSRGYYILKTDLNGNKLWDKNYSDAFSSYAAGMCILSNGNIAIIGTHASVIYSALAEVVLLDTAGNYINSVTYPPFDGWGTSGIGIESTPDSAMVITLYTDGYISTNYYSLFRLNNDLSTRWTQFISYDGSLLNCHSLAPANNEGYYSLAYYDFYYYSPAPIYKASYIRRFDSTGTVLLDSLYLLDMATNSITTLDDGNALISGTQDSTGQKDMVLMKLDSTGNILWQKEYGSVFNEETVCAIPTFDGGYALLANIPDPTLPGQHDVLLLKTDASGDSLWSRRLGSVRNELGLHLEQSEDSGYIILGTSTAFPDSRIYFVKTDSAGIVNTPYSVSSPGRYYCGGDTAVLQLSPSTPPFTHAVWCTGETGNSITVDSTGVYYATIYDTSGVGIESEKISVYCAVQPSVALGPDTIGICRGAALINQITPDLTLSLQWYRNDSIIDGAHSAYIIPTDTGFYKLVISNYCGADSDIVFVDTLYEHPAIPAISSPEVPYVCEFDSLRMSITVDSSFQSQWYYADDFNSYAISGATDSIFYALFQSVYFVTVTDSFGCSSSSDPKPVSFDQVPSNVNSTGPSAFCTGGEIELYVPNGSDYLWSTGDTNQTIAVSQAGDYFVTFTDENGCPKISDTLTITLLANPVISIGPDTSVCNNLSFTFEAPPGFNNYLWSDGSTDIVYDAFVTGNIADTQMVYVFVTDTNGCTTSDTAQIIFDICDEIPSIVSSQIKIYPNPVSSGQSILLSSGVRDTEAFLYDLQGRVVLSRKFDFEEKLKLDFPAGSYLLKMHSAGILKAAIVIIQ
ncbi:MAG: T9SS type A sorting domain-containing protein [Bacteroidetes bacterium]|nr:T9SS type A sorting domain-containing protein [Bacteroidota bacterium]